MTTANGKGIDYLDYQRILLLCWYRYWPPQSSVVPWKERPVCFGMDLIFFACWPA